MSNLYLVATEIYRPRSHMRTTKSGWHEHPGAWEVSEQVKIIDGSLKTRVYSEASIIIDLVNNKVLKNRGSDEDKAVSAYYMKKYQDNIKQSLLVWSHKNPKNLNTLKEMSEATASE